MYAATVSDFLRLLGVIFSDQVSKYTVSGCKAINRIEIDAALKKLKSEKICKSHP